MMVKALDVLTGFEIEMAGHIAENITTVFPDANQIPKERLFEMVLFIAVMMKIGLTTETHGNMDRVLH